MCLFVCVCVRPCVGPFRSIGHIFSQAPFHQTDKLPRHPSMVSGWRETSTQRRKTTHGDGGVVGNARWALTEIFFSFGLAFYFFLFFFILFFFFIFFFFLCLSRVFPRSSKDSTTQSPR